MYLYSYATVVFEIERHFKITPNFYIQKCYDRHLEKQIIYDFVTNISDLFISSCNHDQQAA